MADTTSTLSILDGKLRRFAKKVRLYHALKGTVLLLSLVLLCVLGTLLLDRWLKLSPPVRVGIGLVLLAGLMLQAWRLLMKPQLVQYRPLAVAAALDRGMTRTGIPRGTLTQLYGTLSEAQSQNESSIVSEELKKLAAEQHRAEAERLDLNEHLEYDQFARHYLSLGFLTLVPLLLCLMMPDTASIWWNRWILGSNEKWPQRTWLVVEGMEGTHMVVPRGEPLELRVFARDGSEVPQAVEVDYDFDDRLKGRDALRVHGRNDFRFRLPGLSDRAELTFFGGDDILGPLTFEARGRPSITGFTLTTHLPQTGARTTQTFVSQDRDMSFKAETHMELRCETDQPVASVSVGEANERNVGVEWDGDRAFVLKWIHTARTLLNLELVAKKTSLASRKHLLTFGFLKDMPPEVSLAIEGVRDRITPTASLPIRILARDDEGLSALDLTLLRGLQPDGKDAEQVHQASLLAETSESLQKSVENNQELDLTPFGMKPMRYVFVGARAADQSHLGSQSTLARRRLLRVVEPEQLSQEIRARIEKVRGRLRAALAAGRETRDLIVAAKDRSAVEEVLRRHRNLEREVWSASRTLESSSRELELNKLIEAHATAKLRGEVLDPLSTLHDQTLRDHRLELESGAQNLETLKLEALATRQDVIVKSLETILRNLSEWDSFVDFVTHLNEIIQRQEELRRSTQDIKEGTNRD
jgi:hypothetical protein